MKKLIFTFVCLLAIPSAIWAQGNSFSFQGRLNDGTNPANGGYDLEFRLYTAIMGGTQIGTAVSRPNTALINGVFSVMLDFGPTAFNDPNAVFIEVSVRPNGSANVHTILGPRQQLTVVPIAVRAMNATNADALNGIDSTGFVRNSTAVQPANLNIGGVAAVGYLSVNNDASVNGTLNVNGLSSLNNLNVAGTGQFSQLRGLGLADLNALKVTGHTDMADLRLLGDLLAFGRSNLVGDVDITGNTTANGNLLIAGAVSTRGDITQSRDKGGSVKAMIYVSQGGTIVRCYNGVTGSSTGNCGFSVQHTGGQTDITAGFYTVDFGFRVNDRFISVSPGSGSVTMVASFSVHGLPENKVSIHTNITDVDHLDSFTEDDFMLIVY